jgi:predicted phosphodiesterase
MRNVQPRRLTAAVAVLLCATAAVGCAGPSAALGQTPTAATTGTRASALDIALPRTEGSARFAVIGDTGTGGSDQRRIAEKLIAAHAAFPFEFVLMLGDNLYGSEQPRDYRSKFEVPYKPLLDAGVKFYAALGNHDDTNQIRYKPFNMDGKQFHTFKPRPDLRFFALDSNYMSPEQLEWLDKELTASGSEWKIPFFHHPIYSSGGRHGSDLRLREQLEPLFVKHGVDVVFTGHEHFYERLKPQKGIHYFIVGASAKLRRGDIEEGPIHANGFDQGHSFMLVEVAKDQMHFQAFSDQGRTVDSGVIVRKPEPKAGVSPAGS